MPDEAGQSVQAEAVLTPRELALLAEMTVAEHIERVGVVGSVDDAEVLPPSHLQPGLNLAVGQVGRLDNDALSSAFGQLEPPLCRLCALLYGGEIDEAVPG